MLCAGTGAAPGNCDAQVPCTSHERKFTEKCRAMRRGRAHRKNVLQALLFGDVIMSALINQRNSLFLRCARALHIARVCLAAGSPWDVHPVGSKTSNVNKYDILYALETDFVVAYNR